MQLEELDEKLPAPLSSIYSVKDDPAKPAPIQMLFHGDYLQSGGEGRGASARDSAAGGDARGAARRPRSRG